MENDLEKKFTLLIAQEEGIEPEEVTLEYIRKQRRYRDEVLGLPILGVGKPYLTGKQWKKVEKIVDEFFANIDYKN